MIREFTARAKAILVFGERDTALALLTEIVVKTCRQGPRIRFAGSVTFHPQLQHHIRQVLLPIIDTISRQLGLRHPGFEISAANIGAASSLDKAIQVTGFSADAPLICAMLAALCHLEVPLDLVVTGHLASREGDIRMVSSLAAKLHAAALNPTIQRFLYPDPAADDSLQNLASHEMAELRAVAKETHGRLSLIPVRHVGELVKSVFPEEPTIIAALKRGIFFRRLPLVDCPPPLHQAAAYLVGGQDRFFRAVASGLMRGDSAGVRLLLDEYARFHLHRKRYPTGLGAQMAQTLAAVPPITLRLKLVFPLMTGDLCRRLCNLPGGSADGELLSRAVSGELAPPVSPPEAMVVDVPKPGTVTPSAEAALNYLLEKLDESNLVREIDGPLDEARATFIMASVGMTTEAEFHATITAFYVHVQRHPDGSNALIDEQRAHAEALDWIIRAYAGKGGYEQALMEARTGIQGGLRRVLDQMIDHLKQEKRRAYFLSHFQTAVDPTNWAERVQFLQALMERFPDAVPPELRETPPERFANHNPEIMTALIEGLTATRRLVKTY